MFYSGGLEGTEKEKNMTARPIEEVTHPLYQLNLDCRVRNGLVVKVDTLVRRFFWAIRDWYRGGKLAVERREFSYIYVGYLERTLEVAESSLLDISFFRNVRRLLHIQGKITISGWERSLRWEDNYQDFKIRVENIRARAFENLERCRDLDAETARWIEAEASELQFAAYSNTLPLRSREISIGTVLLFNPRARFALNRIRGQRSNFFNWYQAIKLHLSLWMTGFPVTHAKIALGENRYMHLTKGDGHWRTDGENTLIEEEADKLFYTEEVCVPSEEAWGEERPVYEERLRREWLPLIEASIGNRAGIWTQLSPLFDPMRPSEGYDFRAQYDSTQPYSCSGLISVTLAACGIDIVAHVGKKVEKALPADFITTPYYRLVSSSEPFDYI
jgi:hypothetical protein